MALSSSSSPSKSPVPSLHQSLHFTPILECDEDDDLHEERYKNRATPSSDGGSSATPNHHHHHHRHRRSNNNHQHTLTPLHHNGKPTNRKRHDDDEDDGGAVSCNKCRPHHSHCDKFSVVPLESHNNPSFISSPNLIIKSIFQSLTRRSPKPTSTTSATLPPRSSSSSAADASREEQWRLAVAELSHKLIQATKKKEDAVIEASRLKSSMAELEKKLNKLEIYCHNLKSGLDECSNKKQSVPIRKDGFNDRIIQQFLVSVSESRSSIRALSRSLASQLRTVGGKVYERLSLLLQPFDVKINSFAKNPKSLIFYLEAILSRAFFEDFEASGFQKSGWTRILNPIDRCESNYASFNVLMELTWDEVLSRGTKHFSEEFSRFCDRKMSDVVSMLCWNRAWPEPLLQAFFYASKSVWLVHLLANSVNPGLQIFRVEKDDRFDPVYMEETGGDRFKSLVRAMVQPGFYVYGSVVKCKVVCKHCGSDEEEVEDRTVKECNKNDKSLISICSPLGGEKRIVCVTSGGTTVPLEQRYSDNFSSGNRGAASTENFVKAGYAVIFLYRRGTCQPYCRSLPDDPFLECFEFPDAKDIRVHASHSGAVRMAVMDQQAAVADGRLLKLPFSTMYEYLQMLQLIATTLKDVGPCSMFYLAAAVSDFYVPWTSMTEHKIQSGSGPLDISLAQVPKMLSILKSNWAPKAFCISFKLETDSKILIEKATKALQKYKVHAVVANELSTRKEEVVVVSSSGNVVVRRDSDNPESIVEDNLIRLIVDRHSTYIKESHT